jgi:regulatory protein
MMAANLRYHRPMSKREASLQGRLHEAALFYLGRYEASVQSLRRVLRRRIEAWARKAEREVAAADLAAVEAVIERLVRTGAVDDRRYAEMKSASLQRSGRSARAIRSYLAARGVQAEIGGEGDYEAALLLARKKRLGRFGAPASRAERRRRDLAALGRAGFSFEIARRVVDSDE